MLKGDDDVEANTRLLERGGRVPKRDFSHSFRACHT
jgi:hypothetical protein